MEHNVRTPAYADESFPELLRRLSTDTALLVRQEVALARAELTATAKRATAPAAAFGTAAALGIGAFGALTATLIALLALVLPLWAAAALVTIAYGLGAFVAVQNGKQKLASIGAPIPQTVESVQEDVEAVRAGVRRAR
jgi:hypothetical protein